MLKGKTRLLNTLLYLLLALAFILPRLVYLGQYVTADENLWLRRSANFYYALGQRDFKHTFQMPHPGVMTSWAGTGGFLLVYPEYRGSGAGNLEGDGEFHRLLAEMGVKALDVLVAGRSFVVECCAAALLAVFVLLRRLWGLLPALVAYILVAFDPFYFFLTRVLHLDGLMSSFAMLSLVSLLVYLLGGRKTLPLLLSGAAAGLSWLSKSPGMFLMPFTGLLLLIDHVQQGKRTAKAELWPLFRALTAWGLAGAAVFVLLWPAMWVDPLGTLRAIFNLATTYAEEGHLQFFYGQVGNVTFPWWYYPVTFLWRTTPVVLIGLVAALPAALFKWGIMAKTEVRRAAGALLLYAVLFIAFMQIGEKRFDRYALPIYPALDLLAALGWVALVQAFVGAVRDSSKSALTAGMVAMVALAQAGLTLSHAPYYASAYNPWMGGTAGAARVMTVGWGEGLDQTAAYLNTKVNADNLQVFTYLASGPFSYYFDGQELNMILESGWGLKNAERLAKADYVVVYVSQWQRQLHQPLLHVLAGIAPEHVVTINGVEYAQVYNKEDIPAADLARLTLSGE